MKYGYIQSKLDGTEHKFEYEDTKGLPKEYTYQPYLPEVIDQGRESICVPCSCSAFINYKLNIAKGDILDNKVALHDIYAIREDKKAEGMTFKEALHYLRHNGVKTNKGIEKISEYAMIGSVNALKTALVTNGPCIGGLLVYNEGSKFWDKTYSSECYGGHAICIVGYNEEGFIIRNSWGKYWGNGGHTILPYDEFNNFMEIWTIF